MNKKLEKEYKLIKARFDARHLDYGVKGMKWGHHKQKPESHNNTISRAVQELPELRNGQKYSETVGIALEGAEKLGSDSLKEMKRIISESQGVLQTDVNGNKTVSYPGIAAKCDNELKNCTPEAQEAYNASMEKEEEITNDMLDIAKAVGGTMTGLEFSIKTASSVEDKIIRKRENHRELSGSCPADDKIVSEMGDLVRYTQQCVHDDIAKNASNTIKALEDKGYKIIEVDNKWLDPKSDYKGLHINAIAPNGQSFELQIHSEESMKVKNAIHPMYEKYRNVNTSPERKKELKQKMREISSSLSMPEGIEKIKSFKKEK